MIIFNFLIVSIINILPLNATDTSVPSRKFKPWNIDCYNTYSSAFAKDFTQCLHASTKKSGHNNIDKFANHFTKAMLSIPALQRFLGEPIPVAESRDLFYKLDYNLLRDVGHPMPECPAYLVAQTLGLYHVFSLAVYFKRVGYTIGKFLLIKNIGIGPHAVKCYAYLVERALLSSCVVSDEDLYLLDGFVNFAESQGFRFVEESDLLLQLFAMELLLYIKS